MKTLLKILTILKPHELDVGHLEYTADDRVNISADFYDADIEDIITDLECLRKVNKVWCEGNILCIDLNI